MVSMALVGRMVGRVEPRLLIVAGLLFTALSLWQMSQFDMNVTQSALAWTGLLQGIGMGFMFVPMSTIAFATLEPRFRGDGSGLYSLGRNIGSSIGVSMLMGALAVYVRTNREQLVTFINPFNPLLHDPALQRLADPRLPEGLELLNNIVQREAMMLGYLDDFRLMMLVTFIAIPLVFTLRPLRPKPA